MRKIYLKFIGVLVLFLFAIVVVFPQISIKIGDSIKNKTKMDKFGDYFRETGGYFKEHYKFRLGLDLQGGSHLVYKIITEKLDAGDKPTAVESIKSVIRTRVDQFGVAEPNIYTTKRSGQDYLVVELPGITDLQNALNLIGKTAKLEFKVEDTPDESGIPSYKSNNPPLTGEHLKSASVSSDPNTGAAQVTIEFDEEGKRIFAEMTKANLNKTIAIYLDDQLISAPRVQTEILDGRAVITGVGTIEEAKKLAIQLNAGALPVPIELEENRTIGATLGKDSVSRSVVGGMIGLLAVAIFMIVYYRLLGVLATIALVIYSFISLALFKGILSFILPFTPVTLTLAGIAGFILSIGMAVDANILIFERMREELRSGKSFSLSLSQGFSRAWNSVRDSNVSSLITCVILFAFGSGLIRGFAVTLALGILVSMFTAITVTRTFLQLTTNFRWGRILWLYGVKKND